MRGTLLLLTLVSPLLCHQRPYNRMINVHRGYVLLATGTQASPAASAARYVCGFASIASKARCVQTSLRRRRIS